MTPRNFPRRRQPAPGTAAGQTFGRIPDWDGTTITFGGASGAGLPSGTVYDNSYDATGWDADPGRPPRPPDEAIFTLIPGGIGLLCGIDRWRRHADPEIAHVRYGVFNALRVSALRAGWRPDAFGRWCCPTCLTDPAYTAARPVAHWHAGVPRARTGPHSSQSRQWWQERPATEYHYDAAEAFTDGDPAAEFWFRVEAEVDVLARTAQGAVHGRHAAGAR